MCILSLLKDKHCKVKADVLDWNIMGSEFEGHRHYLVL